MAIPGSNPRTLGGPFLAAHLFLTGALFLPGMLILPGTLFHPDALAGQVRPDSLIADTTWVIEGVVVTGQRQAATVGGATGVVVRPDSLSLRPVASVEEALRELPFVLVRTNSRGQAELSVRGSDSRQMAVLLDGVPLSLGWDHRADTGVLPLMGISTMEFVRGLPSVLSGPNVLGGVLAMNVGSGGATVAHREELRIVTGMDDAGYRALGAAGTAVVAPGASRQLIARAGAGYRTRDGFHLPGGEDRDPATDGLRTNSDFREWNGFGAVRLEDDRGGWLSLSTSGFTAERGVAPELHVQDPRLWRYPEEWQVVTALTAGTGMRRTPLGEGDLELSLGHNVGGQEIASYADMAYDQVVDTEAGEDRTLTARLVGDLALGGSAQLAGAFTLADVRHEEILPGERNDYRQRLWSVGSEMGWRPGPATRVKVGVALDGADTPETGGRPPQEGMSAWGGRVGVSTLALHEEVQLHASASSRARFPALRELYSGALGRFEPNPDLRPERLHAVEAGATLRRDDMELQAVAFHHELRDAVVRVTTPAGKYRRINRDAVRSTGVELLLGASLAEVRLLADLALQQVEVDGGAGGAQRRAEHMPEIRGGVDLTAPLPLGVRGRAGVQYTGEQYCVDPDQGADVQLDGAARLDMGAQRSFTFRTGPWREVRASVAVDNATDAAVYDQCGMPQGGRTFRLGLELL